MTLTWLSVVKYSSAYIDGVESEQVVYSGHSAQSHPKVVGEVQRIPHRHRAQNGRAAGAGMGEPVVARP